MADLIATTSQIIATVPTHAVYVAPHLGRDWVHVPFLYLDVLRVPAAPDVDEALLSYVYGPQQKEDGSALLLYEPQDLLGMYVKVEIYGAGNDGLDIVWYGLIETDDRAVFGSGPNQDQPAGIQSLTAFGLLRLLERVYVRESFVEHAPTDEHPNSTWRIGQGLPFNVPPLGGNFSSRGNRSTDRLEGTNTPYVFSRLPHGQSVWRASTAVQYLLHHHRPRDRFGMDVCDWRLVGDESALDWYDVSVETDGRSVKDILDELIDRRRAVGYYLTYDENAGSRGQATINAYTFVDKPLPLWPGQIIAANPDQKILDFERAFDLDVRLVNTITSRFDRVVAIGEFKTATCTLSLDPNKGEGQIKPDWSDEEEADYRTAASNDVDYAGLSPLDQSRRNQRYRESDQLRHVFRRFAIDPDWNMRTYDFDQNVNEATQWLVAPTTIIRNPDDVGAILGEPDKQYYPLIDNRGEPLWLEGLVLEKELPFRDRFDYSGDRIGRFAFAILTGDVDGIPEFIKPMFFVRTFVGGGPATHRWEFLEKLSDGAVYEDTNRRWSAHAHFVGQRPAFELTVAGAPQHFLSPRRAAAMEAFDASHDPAKEGGLDFEEIRATLCLRLQSRVQMEAKIDAEPVAGRQERVLYIPVKDARLDYVVPRTTVAIKNGQPVITDNGGYVRDDRQRLHVIARAAAEWYGRTRQTISVEVKRVKEVVKLGWLITEIGPVYRLTDINTAVTAITYDLREGTTRFETTFAALELA